VRGERRRPPRHAVDPEPLPATADGRGRAWPDQDDLDDLVVDRALDAGEVRAPADDLEVGRRPVRVPPRE
jgi:hypothetical protein